MCLTSWKFSWTHELFEEVLSIPGQMNVFSPNEMDNYDNITEIEFTEKNFGDGVIPCSLNNRELFFERKTEKSFLLRVKSESLMSVSYCESESIIKMKI